MTLRPRARGRDRHCSRRCSAAAWVALFYAWHPALAVEFDRDLPRNVSGVYPPERDEASGLTFAWTGADVVLRLPGLDRRAGTGRSMLRVRGGRPAAGDNPDARRPGGRRDADDPAHVAPTSRTCRSRFPAQAERRGLTLGLRSSKTFVPGPSRSTRARRDARSAVADAGRRSCWCRVRRLSRRPMSSAAMGAAIALLGVTAGSAIGGAVLRQRRRARP